MSSSPGCVLVAVLAAISGCARQGTNVSTGDRDQILHRGIGAEVGELDPQLAETIAQVDIASALFEGLVAEDPVDLHPVPGVAEWSVLDDRMTYTFRIRPEAKWSNGAPVTADDFVHSWRRVLTPSFAAPNAALLYVLRNAEAYHKGALADFSQVGVAAVDPQTLRVTLDRPVPYFLSLLTHPAWMPVPMTTITAHGSPLERGNRWTRPENFVGNGPFVLKSWEPNQRLIVEKSPSYWDSARVRLNGIHFHPIESRDAEERAFRSGQLHLTYTLPAGKSELYRAEGNPAFRSDPYLDTYFLRINVTRPFLNDVRVRRALSLAVDRQALVDRVLKGGQTPAHAITPPGLGGYTAPQSAATDFEAARRLLESAGYAGGNGLPAFELLFPNSENLRLLAEALQGMWQRELGVSVRLASQESTVFRANRSAGEFQIIISDWVGDYFDPSTFLEIWRTGDANNYTRWGSADYDGLIRQAALATDAAARHGFFARAENLLLEAAPVIPLYYHTHAFLIQPSVKGWNPTLLDHHPYKHVWLEPSSP